VTGRAGARYRPAPVAEPDAPTAEPWLL